MNMKKLLRKTGSLYISENWISNCHFIMNRAMLTSSTDKKIRSMAPIVREMTDHDMIKTLPYDWSETIGANKTYDIRQANDDPYIRMFDSRKGKLGIDEDYVKEFKIGLVRIIDTKSVVEVERNLLYIMPCRV